jgi:hypothetical protein
MLDSEVLMYYLNGIWKPLAEPSSLYTFTEHTFHNAGASGRFGPNINQVRTAYSSTIWANTYINMIDNGIQLWTVPSTGLYQIRSTGASGGVIGGFGQPGGGPPRC